MCFVKTYLSITTPTAHNIVATKVKMNQSMLTSTFSEGCLFVVPLQKDDDKRKTLCMRVVYLSPQANVAPPSTISDAPVMNADSSEAR